MMTMKDSYSIYVKEIARYNALHGINRDPVSLEMYSEAVKMEKELAKGSGKHFQGYKRVAEQFARNDVYITSSKQARAWQKALIKLDKKDKRKISSLRTGEIPSEIETAIDNLIAKNKNLSSTQLAKKVGQEIYGSD